MGHECLQLKSRVYWGFLLQICQVYLVIFWEMLASMWGLEEKLLLGFWLLYYARVRYLEDLSPGILIGYVWRLCHHRL